MAVTDCNALPCASRLMAVPIALLAIVLTFPLGGCSFDLGSWGSDKEKPQALEQKPTGTIGGPSTNDAQGFAAHGQALAKSGKREEALAEFDRALTLDPYNVQEGLTTVPAHLGLPPVFTVEDLLSSERFQWRIGPNYVRLEPGVRQGHISLVDA